MNATEHLRMHREIETEGDKSPVTYERRRAVDEFNDLELRLASYKLGLARDINSGALKIGTLTEQERHQLVLSLCAISRELSDAATKLTRHVHDTDTVPEFLRARA